MTITSQQVDAWDAEVDAAYAAGRQEGIKQERALWTLTKLGQEIEAQQERNFCQRCGKRTADLTTIHTCTPPRGNA